MNFNETMKYIKESTELSQISQFDFMLDYENIKMERITGFPHKRYSSFTDEEIIELNEAVFQKVDELL